MKKINANGIDNSTPMTKIYQKTLHNSTVASPHAAVSKNIEERIIINFKDKTEKSYSKYSFHDSVRTAEKRNHFS